MKNSSRPLRPREKVQRIISIDSFRVIAILAVISLHTQPFFNIGNSIPSLKFLSYLLIQTNRFAVPFFFLVSGYFFGKSIQKGNNFDTLFLSYAKRLLKIFLIWSFIYMLIPYDWNTVSFIKKIFKEGPIHPFMTNFIEAIGRIEKSPVRSILEGNKDHLWFLTALIFSLGLVSIFLRRGWFRCLWALSIALFVFGLAAGSYSVTPLGVSIRFCYKAELAPLFTVLGFWLSKKPIPGLRLALVLTLGGLALQITEAYLLWRLCGSMPNQDFLFGTLPYGIGVFSLALAFPRFGAGTHLPEWGQQTLGIYVSHMLILYLLMPLVNILPWFLREPVFPFLTYFVSLWLVLRLSKNRFTKFLVT